MKKTDIREGVTYQTKTGNAARLVLEITDDWSKAKAEYPYLQEDAPAPYAIFKQMRGKHIGSTSALTLNSFAAWAHSATADTEVSATDLSDTIAQLQADKDALMEALKPFAKAAASYGSMFGFAPPGEGTTVRPPLLIGDLRYAAKILEAAKEETGK